MCRQCGSEVYFTSLPERNAYAALMRWGEPVIGHFDHEAAVVVSEWDYGAASPVPGGTPDFPACLSLQ